MAIYQQKYPTVNHGTALQIVNEILVEWGLSSADNEPEDNGFEDYCEIVLGVAFAQIKYQARCDVEMRNMALDVIQRSKTLHKKSYADWPLLQEKIDSLDMMAGKVNSMNNP